MTPISTYVSASGQTTYMTLGTMPIGITDNMKIKSRTDVITNSSTEVFIVKTTDLEEFKKKHGEFFKDPDGREFKVDTEFWGPSDLTELQEAWNSKDPEKRIRIREIFGSFGLGTGLLVPYAVSKETRKALEFFGHTDQEISSYEDQVNDHRTKAIAASKTIAESLAWKAMVRSGHGRFIGRENDLKKFLDDQGYKHIYWL